jgi:hypothetical protein
MGWITVGFRRICAQSVRVALLCVQFGLGVASGRTNRGAASSLMAGVQAANVAAGSSGADGTIEVSVPKGCHDVRFG